MLIYFYIPTLSAGGAEKQCAMIAAGLRRKGYNANILLDDAGNMKDANKKTIDDANVPLIELPKGAFKKIQFLKKCFASHDDDVCVFSFLTKPNFFASFAGLGIPAVRVYSGIRNERLPGWKYLIELIVNRLFATGTICNSYRARDFFVGRGFAKNRTHQRLLHRD